MSTTVCQQQGVQSRFNSWHFEPRVIGFKFSLSSRCPLRPLSPIDSGLEQSLNALQQQDIIDKSTQHLPTHDQKTEIECENNEFNTKKSTKSEGLGGWSFLQDLSYNNTNQSGKKDNEEVYVHPLVKRSTSMLSEKSLEMCTESLGSETGSIMSSENGDEVMASLLMVSAEIEKSSRIMSCFSSGVRNKSNGVANNLPPPLTTIRGGSGGEVQVKSQREGGRLVIKAVSVETYQSCFKAERKDGRLRLSFSNSRDDAQSLVDHHECKNNETDLEFDHHDDDHDDDDHNDDDDDDEYDENEVEVGSFSRARGCKEEGGGRNKEILNWESFWVATS